jgi:hypothetical protein
LQYLLELRHLHGRLLGPREVEKLLDTIVALEEACSLGSTAEILQVHHTAMASLSQELYGANLE